MQRAIKDSVTIATKVSVSDKNKLYAIAEKLGLSYYQLTQSIFMTLIRYWDNGSELSTEHTAMINAFAIVLKSIIGSYNPFSTKGNGKDSVKGAILLVERKNCLRPQLMYISKSDNNKIQENYNFDTMLSAFLNAIAPDVLERLNDESKILGYFSITQTMRELIMKNSTPAKDIMRAQIEDMFSDIRIDTGEEIEDEVFYQRGYNRNADEYTTVFKKYNVQSMDGMK